MKLPATDMLPRVMKLISEEWREIWDCCADSKLRAPFLRYSTCKYPVTLKPGLGVTQGHWKYHLSIERIRLPIDVL